MYDGDDGWGVWSGLSFRILNMTHRITVIIHQYIYLLLPACERESNSDILVCGLCHWLKFV